MKTIRIFGTRGLILATALGVSVGFASPAFAQVFRPSPVIVNPDGKVTYLGTLVGDYSRASGINDSGQVVGYSRTAAGIGEFSHAFITGPDGMGVTYLGTGLFVEASGINESGQVVGIFRDGYITRHGFLTGFAYGFITGPNGMGMTDLGTLTPYSRSIPSGINDSGQVVGWSEHGRYQHAFITGPDGTGMTDLGTLGGPDSQAYGINDSGQVVGWSDTTEGYRHAFITGPDGMGMTDLGTLGGFSSEAYGINDSGQVVGISNTTERGVAFITGPGGVGMTDLNSLVDLPDAVFLFEARGINNQEQVIATIIPEPASYALMLAGLGLVGFMARGKKLPGNNQSALS